MSYPLISEYTEAILSAEDNFAELSYLRPVLDDFGRPIMSSGNFAVVYKMRDPRDGKFYAVKCFTRDQEGRENTYKEITDYIAGIYSKYLIPVKYLANELFVDSNQTSDTEFPILLMDWVDGLGMEEYITQNLPQTTVIQNLFDKFINFIAWLLPSHIAHGDLKPDNIIITPEGEIRLIDYDGMFVPSMFGKEASELGTPKYQYINRKQNDFNEYLDDYAAIYLSLLLKLVVIEKHPISKFLSLDRESFVAYLSKYIEDVQVSKLLSVYLIANAIGFIDRDTLSNALFDEYKRNRSLELRLIHDALNGDTQAMIHLGDSFSHEKFTPSNQSKAYDWYSLARLIGNVNASCGICRHFYHFNNDYHGLRDFCKNPLHTCMVNNAVDFALCREAEENTHKDKDHAIEFFTKASEQNFAPATHWLAISKQLGTKNLDLLIKAAKQNYTSSLRAMGRRYEDGEDVTKDLNEAFIYYKKAAELGDDEAQYTIALTYLYGLVDNLKDETKAIYWLEKSALQGNTNAIVKLSICYLLGKGIAQNYSAAFTLLLRNQSSQNENIQRLLGYCHEQGYGTEVNYHKAYNRYIKAIHSWGSGCSWAENRLEIMCQNHQLDDETKVFDNEITEIGLTNTGSYSPDGKRFLRYWCTYGEEYTVKDGCEVLCDDSFNDLYSECDGHYLEVLTLPESLKRIGNNVFCASIKEIVCHSLNFRVNGKFLLSQDEKTLFRYFGESEVVIIPPSVKYIKGGAFSGVKVNNIVLPANIRYIGDNPFARTGATISFSGETRCFKLIANTLFSLSDKRLINHFGSETSIRVPFGTEIIGKNAFIDSKLESIYLPASIKTIHESAFYYCYFSLKKIIVPNKDTANLVYNILSEYNRNKISIQIEA